MEKLFRIVTAPPADRGASSNSNVSNVDDLVLDPDVLNAMRRWLETPTKCAMVTAPVGSGMTTALRLLVRELGIEAVWTNGNVKNFRELLFDAGSCDVCVDGRRKLVIVDEFDASRVDKRAMTVVVDYSKSSAKTPMMCVGHPARSSKAFEFAAKWTRFEFPDPPRERIFGALCRTGIGSSDANDLCDRFGTDLRAAIIAANAFDDKDEFLDGLDGVDEILRGERSSVEDVMRVYAWDPSVVSMGIFENYASAMRSEDVKRCERIADAFSLSDIVETVMYATQNWKLHETYGALSVAAPALEFGRTHRRPVEKFGTVWSKTYNQKAKEKNARIVARACFEAGISALPTYDLAYRRTIIENAIASGNAKAVRSACEPFDDHVVLLIMRLGFKPYKHAPTKKMLKC